MARIVTLTTQRAQIIAMLANGLKYDEIGQRLFITRANVEYHLGDLFKKLPAKNGPGLVTIGFLAGLLTLTGFPVEPTGILTIDLDALGLAGNDP